MKLVVFGATGSIGRRLVAKALAKGHRITAFARRPNALGLVHRNLTRVAGDVFDEKAVADAVRDQDAVLIALGAGRKGKVRAAGTRHIVAAMARWGVHRLICQSTLGAGDSRPALNFFWKHLMFGFLLRDAYADHEAQEAIVTRSDLDWTIARPAAFTDGPATGAYKHGFPANEPGLRLKVSREDVADFLLRQIDDDSYLRQSPGLSY